MSRVVHISNRVVTDPKKASGGLDNTIKSNPGFDQILRIGWSGNCVTDEYFFSDPERHINVSNKEFQGQKFQFVTIDDPKKMFNGFYGCTSNELIWALTHRRVGLMRSDEKSRQHYMDWNKIVADIASRFIDSKDDVLIHDYHHLPLGSMLREKGVKNPLGIYIHTPFIEQKTIERARKNDEKAVGFICELFNKSMFDYDMVGLQAPRDLYRWQEEMGVDPGKILSLDIYESAIVKNSQGDSTLALVAPAISDFEHNQSIARQNMNRPDVKKFLKKITSGKRGFVSGDRVDHSKSLPMKMEAIRVAIEDFGISPERIQLLQAVQMGRENVFGYQREREKTELAYRELRRDFGNVATIPYRQGEGEFDYNYEGTELKGLPQSILFSAYARAIGGLFTSLIDGQHLGPSEFYACTRPARPGVPIITRSCGASVPFAEASVIVEPETRSIAEGMEQVLNMPLKERKKRYKTAMEIMETHNNKRWLRELVEKTKEGYAQRSNKFEPA
jgi:trehalose 6-phosphate synthase